MTQLLKSNDILGEIHLSMEQQYVAKKINPGRVKGNTVAAENLMTPEERIKIDELFIWLNKTAKALSLTENEQQIRIALYKDVISLRPTDGPTEMDMIRARVQKWIDQHKTDPLCNTLQEYIEAKLEEKLTWQRLFDSEKSSKQSEVTLG